LAENVRIPSYRGEGVENCSKNRHMIFEHSLFGKQKLYNLNVKKGVYF